MRDIRVAYQTTCPNCRSNKLAWHCTTTNNSDVQNGRLRLHEVDVLFYIGCDECSETVHVESGNKIAARLNKDWPRLVEVAKPSATP